MKLLQRQPKGQVLVLVALVMVVLLAIAALAIDIGRAYGVKAKLNAAVDAASLEAANALAQGSGESGMIAEAKTLAANYFSANYPGEFLGAIPGTPTVTAVHDSMLGTWTVNVKASAKMPTIFAGVLEVAGLGGLGFFNVGATSEAVRATVDMVLVLDTTNSLGEDFPKIKIGSQNFLEHFNQLDDRVGMVAFATGAYPIVSICGDYRNYTQNPDDSSLNCGRGFQLSEVQLAIGDLYKGGMTDSEEGLKKALDQLNALPKSERSAKRAVVFFSDGAPNTFNGRFPLASGGTIEGNLYSGPKDGQFADTVFDPAWYIDNGSQQQVVLLPETDAKGNFSTRNRNRRGPYGAPPADTMMFKCDANMAARNMAENVADEIRRQGITVFTLGYGEGLLKSEVDDPSCPTHEEPGSLIMKRLANTRDSDAYDRSQPVGIYCHAVNINELERCFDQIAYGILRISK